MKERMTASEIIAAVYSGESPSVEFTRTWHEGWVRPIVERFQAAHCGRVEYWARTWEQKWESGVRRLPTRRDDG